MIEPRSASAEDEFYVGYLPMPPAYVFYLRMLMPVLLWLAVGAAAVVSSSQFDAGPGTWNTGQPQSFEGVVDARPYALLRVPGGANGAVFTTFLLVETGKFGGGKRAASFDGQYVRVSGWLIERDGRRMIELDPGDSPIAVIADRLSTSDATFRSPARRTLATVTLRGEIVDSKCFLGVMKPGFGKTHKECATLCIAGGIPPMLVTQDATGKRDYYLLTTVDGNALDDQVLPFVADPVEVTGDVETLGDLRILRLHAGTIHRL